MDELELPIPLNDLMVVEIPTNSVVDSVFVDNDVGWIKFNFSNDEEVQKRRFIAISEFAPEEDNYFFIGVLRTSAGDFDVFELIDL